MQTGKLSKFIHYDENKTDESANLSCGDKTRQKRN